MQAELNRLKVRELMRKRPFQKFILSMVGGERIIIEHPENIAFNPNPGSQTSFYVIGDQMQQYSTFESISSIATLDELFQAAGMNGSSGSNV